MGYELVDFTKWKRAEKFNYFTTKERCVISLTCDVDVTDFVRNCKEKGLNFYTAFICVLSYTLNVEEHFRYGRDENGNLILFDYINPFFTDFIAETNDFNCMTTEYTSDMNELYNSIALTREKNKGKEILVPENMTDNMFSITVLPWVHYRHLDIIESNLENMLAPSVRRISSTILSTFVKSSSSNFSSAERFITSGQFEGKNIKLSFLNRITCLFTSLKQAVFTVMILSNLFLPQTVSRLSPICSHKKHAAV